MPVRAPQLGSMTLEEGRAQAHTRQCYKASISVTSAGQYTNALGKTRVIFPQPATLSRLPQDARSPTVQHDSVDGLGPHP